MGDLAKLGHQPRALAERGVLFSSRGSSKRLSSKVPVFSQLPHKVDLRFLPHSRSKLSFECALMANLGLLRDCVSIVVMTGCCPHVRHGLLRSLPFGDGQEWVIADLLQEGQEQVGCWGPSVLCLAGGWRRHGPTRTCRAGDVSLSNSRLHHDRTVTTTMFRQVRLLFPIS